MEVLKAYKFRLEPTAEQAQMLDQWVGNARFVWNKALAMNLHRLDNHWRIMRYNELCKFLTLWCQSEDYGFLRLSPIHTLQQKLKDLDRAFSDAFDKNQPNKRIPRMKKRGKSLDSIRFPDRKSMAIGGEHNTIKLPKLGETKFRRSRRLTPPAPEGEGFDSCFIGRRSNGYLHKHYCPTSSGQAAILTALPPHNTSRECPACSHTDADNRKTQARFECVDCGFVQNADVVGAMNILSRGLRAVMPVEVIA
jgi:transposase